MKTLLVCVQVLLLIACLPLPETPAVAATERQERAASGKQQERYAELRTQAEKKFAEGSYQLAFALYEEAAKLELGADERRWVEFRLADTRARSAAQTNDPDTSTIDRAIHDLRAQLQRYERPETRDELFAEIHEALGDTFWRENHQDWGTAWSHYSAALDWWAESNELERARLRYLGIVWKAAVPDWRERAWGTYYPSYVPIEVLANAVEIAASAEEQARAHFLLGLAWKNQAYDRRASERVQRELGSVLEVGKASEWYDDALFALASFFESGGRWEKLEPGGWQMKPDYARALELHQRVIGEFKKGETRYYDQSVASIRNITAPTLMVQVERFFLPGSEVQYTLSWRNLERVELALHPVDLTRDVQLAASRTDDWLSSLQLARSAPSARWTHDTKDQKRHEPGQAALVISEKPSAGAYVLLARGPGVEARALVLVSDAALTVKASGTKLLAWATEVKGGVPLAEADVQLWESWHDGRDWRLREQSEQTGADGIALFQFDHAESGGQYFLALKSGARQSFAQGWLPGRTNPARDWRIYAYTDRSTYRPGNQVNWTAWARTRFASAYQTPAGETVSWEIRDPQGAVVNEGQSLLNAFGAAWSSLETKENAALGEYHIQFFQGARGENRVIGDATLFRLEEYKLPEYEVAVKTPLDADGKPKLFRLGDRVEVEIESTYYYGAPVADATVEVFVHQRPRYRLFQKEREFPWFYDDAREITWWGGQGQQILHETKRSDPAGRVQIAFDTPADAQGEFEFVVEARVTDASRREITGSGSVLVAEQGYTVTVEIEHAIHRPGTKVAVEFRAADVNGNPVMDDGRVEVTRERWLEIWLDPSGKEVTGDALRVLQSSAEVFPRPGWSLKFQGYEREPVAQADLRTDKDGKARFEFTPAKEGYYRVAWSSLDEREAEIRAEATLFVADENTRELGYLPGGIEILVDQDTLEVGKNASILLLLPTNGRWVLFTVEGEDLLQHQVLQLSGQVKLIELPITELHVPNVYLGAVALWGGRAYQDTQELIVPPVKQFLSVELTADRADYEPGQQGELRISVKDHSGEPVSAALSLSVVDEAIAYIQQDYAIDPRRFFYGEKRALLVQSGGTFQHGWFELLAKDAKGDVRDQRYGFVGGEKKEGDEFRLGMLAKSKQAFERRGDVSDALSEFPAAAPVPQERAERQNAAGAGGPQASAVRVRSDFRETALWVPDLVTDKTGQASARVTFPDSTTRWKAFARTIDMGTRVGSGSTVVRTRLPLIARLQAPRFFVVGDTVTLSANLNNNTDSPLVVQPVLEAKGLSLASTDRDTVTVPANGQTRVDWIVEVKDAGTATLKLSALGETHSDAVERVLPIYPHGIEAFVNLAGKLDSGSLQLTLVLPKERRVDSTALEVSLAPSLAVTMLDALPYLADYPYGCTEQTLSRFLPAVIVAKTLRDFGLSTEDAMTRVFGGIEPDSAQKTHPKGKQALDQLDQMTRAGLERLYDFQHADGGWAWWKEGDSDHFMTAYVLWGLALAREAGLDVRAGVLENAARFLAAELVERESEPDLQSWMLHAMARFEQGNSAALDAGARKFRETAFANLFAKRDALNAYSRALLALSAKSLGKESEARTLLDNLKNGVLIDRSPDTSIVQVGAQRHQPYVLSTAHWGQDGIYLRWSEGGVEATAFALRALVAIDPKDELVQPVMNWLVKNRRGAQWSNTRDTAITLLALADYLRASGELGSAVEYELAVNGRSIATQRLEKDQLLSAPGVFRIDTALLRDGANEIQLTKKEGQGPLYFSARARFFSLEEPIPSRGSEIFVRRECYRLAARPTLLKGTLYERVLLKDGESVKSGERVEVVLTMEAKNELEYMVFEDLKPAGFEAVQIRSGEPIAAQELKRSESEARFGEPEDASAQDERKRGTTRGVQVQAQIGEGYTGRSRGAHQELRDRMVSFFLDKLPQGTWELRYELRAEAPGSFHALPTLAHAMYVPEIRANGEELRVVVLDR